MVDIKSAQVCNANAKKALDTKRKVDAAKADRQSARLLASSWGISARSSSRRISTRSLTKRISTRGVVPQPCIEPLQQATTDEQQSAVDAISNVSGRRKHAVRSASEGVAAVTHVAFRDEQAAYTCITRPREFDPEMSRVAHAAGLSILGILVLSTLYSAGAVGFTYGLGTALEGEAVG